MTHTSVLNKIKELGYKGFKEAYIKTNGRCKLSQSNLSKIDYINS